MSAFRIARVLLASTLIAPLSQAVARADEERLGEVNFPISCSPAAQQQFDRAVAMQHSFFFPETVKAFTAIAEKEPSCAMAYWGVAISQRPNPLVGPFPGDVLKRGWEAIEKARAASQKTEREIAWIEALAAYYQDYATVPQQKRTADYEAAMARLWARYPDDAEAAIFYALALNEAADPADKTYARQLKAADILEKLEPKYPNHPGIPHYIIHSYDYPELAMRGVLLLLRAARGSHLRRRMHCTCPRTSSRLSACGRRWSVRIARPMTRRSHTRLASIRRPPPILRKIPGVTISSIF